MIELPPVKEIDVVVPDKVITSMWNILDEAKRINNIETQEIYTFSLKTYYLQKVPDKHAKFVNAIPQKMRAYQIEQLRLRYEWLGENEDYTNVKDFVTKHVIENPFNFRFDILGEKISLLPHEGHRWPRIFIPMHENDTIYTVQESHKKSSMRFNVGRCYLFDVTKIHGVDNSRGAERTVGLFSFDPNLNCLDNLLR